MKLERVMVCSVLVLGALVAVACGDDDDSAAQNGAAGGGGSGGSGGSGDQVYPEAVGPGLSELKQGWNTLAPGGDTTCSKGTPFSYFVRPGASDKVVIEFSGGGACWNDSTCPLADAVFSPEVVAPGYVADETTAKGISNHGRDDNPVKDWTHVFISYCTGDIHAGDNVKTYNPPAPQPPITINHKGAANTRAALAWIFKNIPAPQKVLVTGCSAGGYGATFWAPHVKRHYDQAKIYHFSDSAAGIVSPSFFQEINDSWKPQGVYPTFIPNSDPSVQATLSSFYVAVSNFYPDMPMTQLNSLLDKTQSLYFNFVTQKNAAEWSKQMLAEMAAIRSGGKNFAAFLTPGDKHCVLPDDDFYNTEVEGKKVAGWLGDIVNDQPAVDVTCPECK